MNKVELVKWAWDMDNPDQYSHHSDDFQVTLAPGGPPMDLDSWLAMEKTFRSAFPDGSVVMEDIREEGDDVVITHHLSGTFTNDFDLSTMGLGVVPATGKVVNFPSTTERVSFDGDEISRADILDTGPDVGVAGVLKALGVKMG
jgi:predicted ester cyclase